VRKKSCEAVGTPWLKIYLAGMGFWISACLLSLIYYPLLTIYPVSRKKRQRLAVASNTYWFSKFIALLKALELIEVNVKGKDQFQKEGALIISNHPSLLDVIILVGCIPGVQLVVKETLLKNPLLGLPMRLAGYISNEDPFELLQKCKEDLANGRKILLFPEGTRTIPGQPIQFSRSPASIGVLTSSSIIPVFLRLEPKALYKGQSWTDMKGIRFPLRYDIEIGHRIHPEDMDSPRRTQALNQRLEALYRDQEF
jgi:1-acyl-sn-glycerol-3-phosphate acyltransferase